MTRRLFSALLGIWLVAVVGCGRTKL